MIGPLLISLSYKIYSLSLFFVAIGRERARKASREHGIFLGATTRVPGTAEPSLHPLRHIL